MKAIWARMSLPRRTYATCLGMIDWQGYSICELRSWTLHSVAARAYKGGLLRVVDERSPRLSVSNVTSIKLHYVWTSFYCSGGSLLVRDTQTDVLTSNLM